MYVPTQLWTMLVSALLGEEIMSRISMTGDDDEVAGKQL
jgi:hypothetical protein